MAGGPASGRARTLHDRALGLLAVRARSRRELLDRLVRAGFDRSDVADELDRLSSAGLVDDVAFAKALVEHHVGSRRSGSRGIRQALASRGVSSEIAEQAIAGSSEDGADRAQTLAAERANRLRGLPPDKAYARLVGLLLRRGHSPEVARSAVRRVLDVASGEDSA